jgi:hypothetical protein
MLLIFCKIGLRIGRKLLKTSMPCDEMAEQMGADLRIRHLPVTAHC